VAQKETDPQKGKKATLHRAKERKRDLDETRGREGKGARAFREGEQAPGCPHRTRIPCEVGAGAHPLVRKGKEKKRSRRGGKTNP